MNIDILGISELKWTGMGKFNSDDHYIYYCGRGLVESGSYSGQTLALMQEGSGGGGKLQVGSGRSLLHFPRAERGEGR